jgi:hypothetical protein
MVSPETQDRRCPVKAELRLVSLNWCPALPSRRGIVTLIASMLVGKTRNLRAVSGDAALAQTGSAWVRCDTVFGAVML